MKPSGNTFVISGGCSGLGLQTARDLHAAGAYVSLLDLNAEAGEKIVQELGKERSRFFETDVSDTKSVEKAVEGSVAWARETGKPLAGVVAAAGVGAAAKVCCAIRWYIRQANGAKS
jgi:3-hydroxyacyl-CoA dehydrogenase / 3-hydroxy-2-methylbutyryl-CoA dehydrogenase